HEDEGENQQNYFHWVIPPFPSALGGRCRTPEAVAANQTSLLFLLVPCGRIPSSAAGRAWSAEGFHRGCCARRLGPGLRRRKGRSRYRLGCRSPPVPRRSLDATRPWGSS